MPGESPPQFPISTRRIVSDRDGITKTHTVVAEVQQDVADTTRTMVSDVRHNLLRNPLPRDPGPFQHNYNKNQHDPTTNSTPHVDLTPVPVQGTPRSPSPRPDPSGKNPTLPKILTTVQLGSRNSNRSETASYSPGGSGEVVSRGPDGTKHPEGDQPSEGLETVVESENELAAEDELAIPAMPGLFDTDYLLERPGKQPQFGAEIARNVVNSPQSLLSRDGAHTRDDGLPLMVHSVPDSSNLVDLDVPACKRLISRTPSPQEVTSLIETIFMSKEEVKMIRDLRGDDAQTFVDVIHGICFAFSFLRRSLTTYFLPLLRSRTSTFCRHQEKSLRLSDAMRS